MRVPQTDPVSVRVLTHNIRYATKSPFKGELPWTERRRGLISQLRYHTRDSTSSPFICLQEVLHEQLLDIHAGLNLASEEPDNDDEEATSKDAQEAEPTWSYIGVGRDDGKTAGEYSPIFYRGADWTLLENSTVWLSETPSKPSKSWDAASTRILTVGIFRHNLSRKIVLALNTHLDDQGSKSREEAAKIILKVLREIVVKGRRYDVNGAFLAGDLNSQDGQEAYSTLNAEGSGLRDMRAMIPTMSNDLKFQPISTSAQQDGKQPIQQSSGFDYYGNEFTFTGFDEAHDKWTRIDFIHLETGDLAREKQEKWNMDADHGKTPWTVGGYSVLPNKFDDGVWISDHRAVVGDLLLS